MRDLRTRSNPIFITTDNCPIFIGDRYHIMREGEIEHWRCDEGDEIPTENTYSEWKNVQNEMIKRTNKEKEDKEREIWQKK